MFLTGLGSTETAPMAIARMWQSADSTNMGVPVPGVELKLVPNDGKLEARVKGPNIMPGYWRQPELTAKVFDAEGYYCLGDAVRFEDPADPREGPAVRRPHRRGLQAGDRHLGQRRAAAGAVPGALRALRQGRGDRGRRPGRHPRAGIPRTRCLPHARAGPAGQGQRRRHRQATRRCAPRFQQLLEHASPHASTGSSNRIVAAMVLLADLPSLDAGEITDKGSINQRAVLRCRAKPVADLYAKPVPAYVFTASPG